MRTILLKVKLFLMKLKLKREYKKLISLTDRELSCGTSLMEYIIAEIPVQRKITEETYQKCLKIEKELKNE